MSDLTDGDRQSAAFQKLVKHYEERLATLRSKNDRDLDLVATAKLRGRLHEVNAFLALAKGEPVPSGSE